MNEIDEGRGRSYSPAANPVQHVAARPVYPGDAKHDRAVMPAQIFLPLDSRLRKIDRRGFVDPAIDRDRVDSGPIVGRCAAEYDQSSGLSEDLLGEGSHRFDRRGREAPDQCGIRGNVPPSLGPCQVELDSVCQGQICQMRVRSSTAGPHAQAPLASEPVEEAPGIPGAEDHDVRHRQTLSREHRQQLIERPDRAEERRVPESDIVPVLLHLLEVQNQIVKIFEL